MSTDTAQHCTNQGEHCKAVPAQLSEHPFPQLSPPALTSTAHFSQKGQWYQLLIHQAWIPTTLSPLRMNNVSAPNPLCWLHQGLGDAAQILAEWQETKVVSAWAGTWLSAISKSMILQDADLGQHFLLATVKESTRANCIRAKPSSQILSNLKINT